jgi:putative ABC transport system substrate-binding protein
MGSVGRRGFLLFAAGCTLGSKPAWSVRRIPRIGLLGPSSRFEGQALLTALRNGLDHLGWAEGRDIVILDRWADGHLPRLSSLAAELTASGVDLLVTAGTPATLAARGASSSIPIVMVGVEYPALRLLGDGARPETNITGLSLRSPELTDARLRILQQLIPNLDRIAVILRDEPGVDAALDEIRRDARRLDLGVTELVISSGQTIERAFLWMRANHCRALYFASGPLGPAKRAQVIALAAAALIAVVYPFHIFASEGGLVSVSADDQDLFWRAAGFVDQVLNGTRPADLPIAQPAKFELVINLAAARGIGVGIPKALLTRADSVIDHQS